MSNIYLLLLFSFFSIRVFSQRQSLNTFQFHGKTQILSVNNFDTLYPPALDTECGAPDKYRLYPANNGGFVSGTNGYNDIEKGQFFPNKTGFISELKVLFGAKKDNGGFVRALVYGNNSGNPGTLFGISEALNISEIDTSGNLSTFIFNNPVPVLNGFFIMVEVNPGNNNSVGIITTQDPCSPSFAWEKWSNSLFYPYTSGQGWNLRIDHVFYVVFNETQVNIKETSHQKPFRLLQHANWIEINGTEMIHNMDIIDWSGKLIFSSSVNQNSIQIDKNKLPKTALILINGKYNFKFIQ
jgi:hypothetical protein